MSDLRFGAYIIHYAGAAAFPDIGSRTRLEVIRDDALRLGLLEDRHAVNDVVDAYTARGLDDLLVLPDSVLWPEDVLTRVRLAFPYLTLLYEAAKCVKPDAILEIGVRAGYGSHAMLQAAPKARYVGIDVARGDDKSGVEAVEWARKSLKEAGYDATVHIQDSCDEWPESTTAQKYGVIHVDGGHEADTCLNDLQKAWPLLADGGVMLLDDYDFKDVRDATAQFFANRTDATQVMEVSKRSEFKNDLYGLVGRRGAQEEGCDETGPSGSLRADEHEHADGGIVGGAWSYGTWRPIPSIDCPAWYPAVA